MAGLGFGAGVPKAGLDEFRSKVFACMKRPLHPDENQ